MRNLIFVCMVVSIFSCKEEETTVKIYQDYMIAGDTINTSYFRLNYDLENYTTSDSIPSHNIYGQSAGTVIPINIDNDPILDIRYGFSYLKERDFLVGKIFFVVNNYGDKKNIEFAVQQQDYPGLSLDTSPPDSIKLIATFNKSDTINANQRWVKDPDVKELYYLSYYYNFQPYFDHYNGHNLFYNGDVLNKYIAIRKKVNEQYIYGWIEFSITNYERLEISGCAFADQ